MHLTKNKFNLYRYIVEDFHRHIYAYFDEMIRIDGSYELLDWKPDVMYCDLYCIGYDGYVITWKMQGGCRFLAFPTEEMRDAFKDNFYGDIDVCKEFL